MVARQGRDVAAQYPQHSPRACIGAIAQRALAVQATLGQGNAASCPGSIQLAGAWADMPGRHAAGSLTGDLARAEWCR